MLYLIKHLGGRVEWVNKYVSQQRWTLSFLYTLLPSVGPPLSCNRPDCSLDRARPSAGPFRYNPGGDTALETSAVQSAESLGTKG